MVLILWICGFGLKTTYHKTFNKSQSKFIKNSIVKGENIVKQENMQNTLAKNTLDDIPNPLPDAQRITGLVKKGGKVTGYRLSNSSVLPKAEAIQLARSGGIAGVGIAHRGDTEYLKSIPDGTDNNNLSHLPTVSL